MVCVYPNKDIQRQFLIECLITDLARILIDEYGYSMDCALDVIYNSRTFEKLENPKTRLYYQSTAYLEDMLQEEIGFSKYSTIVANIEQHPEYLNHRITIG